MIALDIAIVAIVAFAVNVPLGIWREGLRKFSPGWFLAVHLSVPFVIALRMSLDLSMLAVPGLIGAAILGQFIGARWRRRRGISVTLALIEKPTTSPGDEESQGLSPDGGL